MNRQVSVTQEQALKKNFSVHRIIFSPVGILKALSIILFLVGPIISLSVDICSKYKPWLELTFPIVTLSNGVFVATLYVASILGLAKKFPNTWIKVDIVCCIIFAIITLVLSVLVIANCMDNGGISAVPGILGIIGALLLFVTAAVLFMTWQNSEDDAVEIPIRPAFDPKRKSVMI